MKTLYFSHGDKGGCGKSVLAAFIVERLLNDYGSVHLVESDPSQPDLATRYEGVPGVSVGFLPLNRAGDSENAVSKFGKWLEAQNAEHVVVNLPAGASETLDDMGDMIRDLSDGLGYRLVITYSLEKNGLAADMLEKSFKSGLMSFAAPEDRFVVYPLFKGEVGEFAWVEHPARKNNGCNEIQMPVMKNADAWKKLEATPGRIADLVDKNCRPAGWGITDQSGVVRFYNAAMTAISPIFEEA
ncbi:hypothetical protein A6M27_18020 [Acidithiobacillus thiooxidans]|uniref:Mobilization protein n=1 Tax=Acidithiobacillus thiooxidans TaxID=930 RepID=A0A1C2J485_ACITH|nr:hypothetical protein [Acidithiobacillus thiooxidans]OCX69661.1 hypothetical protein A6P07_16000 [Acidithiobacillus thiooxidans]OCX75795.1 hypothetical protein A6O24_09445 [Acidithiobacillus thiooxidans]OCX82017.1 hypothetical protein A6O26_11135 [Acidithiobacillus thiooxidans]OCX83053.1 hypothetical protein A6M27_18020 [Acidithiobacillus thiooxidans]OFC41868.1 hypothetical protein BAE47_16935 [Acidithiobacillus thiooxidans]